MVSDPARLVRRVQFFVAVVRVAALVARGGGAQRRETLLRRANQKVLLFVVVTSHCSFAAHVDRNNLKNKIIYFSFNHSAFKLQQFLLKQGALITENMDIIIKKTF